MVLYLIGLGLADEKDITVRWACFTHYRAFYTNLEELGIKISLKHDGATTLQGP
jgi:hypothetical protein